MTKPVTKTHGGKKEDARAVALSLLDRVTADKGYSNILLNSQLEGGSLSALDAAFTTTLVYGVLEKMICLDFFISHYAKRSAKDIEPKALNIIRLGAYQIMFLDKVPDSAAVNESVRLIKSSGAAKAAGLVNAVLRRISENKQNLPYPDREKDFKRYLHVKYSCPQWLLKKWIDEYGKETTAGILEGIEQKPKAVLRVNTLKTTADELITRLSDEGVTAEKVSIVPDCLKVDKLPNLHKSKAFNEGLFTVQNTASQLCCYAAGARPGDTVIDMCAAPGGKSFTLAFNMQNRGIIKSLELYEQRLKLISDGAKRLSIDIIKTMQNDASKHNESLGLADIVMCDVPCSGLGVIGRKPEIKMKNPVEFDELPDLQYSIICESSGHVKVGGKLVYSTCTLSRAENEQICEKFLNEHKSFALAMPKDIRDIAKCGANEVGATFLPHITGSDGFFVAVFKKIS